MGIVGHSLLSFGGALLTGWMGCRSPKGGSAGEDIALTLKKPPTAKKWGVSFDSQHVSAGVFMHAVKSVTADSPCNG